MWRRLQVRHPFRLLVWLLRGGPPPGPAMVGVVPIALSLIVKSAATSTPPGVDAGPERLNSCVCDLTAGYVVCVPDSNHQVKGARKVGRGALRST
jgi:hypothetical protein